MIFKSIEEAKDFFDCGRWLFIGECCEHMTTIQDRTAYLTELLAAFLTSLDALVERMVPKLTTQDQISVAVLRLHTLHAQVTLQISASASTAECPDNALLPKMRHMVELGQSIATYLSTTLNTGARSFCLDMGYVIPLFTVASQCPDRSLRREAIRILRFLPRQEGLWDSLLVAKAAERILEIEENLEVQLRGCAGKLMESQLGLAPSVLEINSNGGRLRYIFSQGDNDVSDIMVEELFTW